MTKADIVKNISDQTGVDKTDVQMIEKIPEYLNAISLLEKENSDLKAERIKLDEEHSKDLEKVEGLVVEFSKLMENNDA